MIPVHGGSWAGSLLLVISKEIVFIISFFICPMVTFPNVISGFFDLEQND